MNQVQNAEWTHERNTIAKLLEFKLKYLVSYSQLMRNYYLNMVLSDIAPELKRIDELPENQDLDSLGVRLLVAACLIAIPTKVRALCFATDITESDRVRAYEMITSEEFKEGFKNLSMSNYLPSYTLEEIKHLKAYFIDPLVNNNQEGIERLGNFGRMLGSWMDGMLDYIILKFEVA